MTTVSQTNFIYLERLDRAIAHSGYTVDDFAQRIIAFYEKMDAVGRNRFDE